MNNPLISVVVTTYKRRVNEIQKAIYSVLNQTYTNLELTIVDDSPESYVHRDEVKTFCENIPDERVKYIQHEKNSGACIARNTGLAHSKGELISFLDDDDEYLPFRMEKMIGYFSAPNVVMVYADAAMYNNGKYRNINYSDTMKPRTGYIYDEIMKEDFIGSTSMAMLRTDILRKAGGFNPEMEACQDWETWIRVSQYGEIAYCPEVVFNYYAYDGDGADARISNDTNRRIRAVRHLNDMHADYLKEHKEALAVRKAYELRLHIKNGDIKNAVDCYLGVLSARPAAVLRNFILLKAFGRLWIKKKQ
ncbi:MAG: glycosyltransferase [Clostridiales bacterium]|nr:glycosyltransferase [Clostridiales bacterium]